jgi:putative transposase
MYLGNERKHNRWSGFDYNQSAYYFITICINYRRELLGIISDGKMILNNYGQIVEKYIKEIPNHYKDVEIDIFAIMPNHVHLNILIKGNNPVGVPVGTEHCSVPTFTDLSFIDTPTGAQKSFKRFGLLSKIVKSFKEMTVKQTHKQFGDYKFKWQRSFYDRIVRDEAELYFVREYIKNNPAKWVEDRNNPNFVNNGQTVINKT